MEKNSFVIKGIKRELTDELVLLAKELRSVIGRLIGIGRCCGMQINVGKTKVMRISRRPPPMYKL
jgi:hypothetical protein